MSDLGERVGKQELFTRQSPQRLKALRESAMVQSAVSSNRIEGVEIDQKRVGTVVFGAAHLRDRGEEEIAGYRDALRWIHRDHRRISLDEDCLLQLHRLSRGDSWDAGAYKQKPVDILETSPDGSSRIRFRSVSPEETPGQSRQMIAAWHELRRERVVAPALLLAALNLDFLCIHPFRDGNGRVSRLLLLLCCYETGMDVGRYISLERLIEEHKERYYETLELSSRDWHEGRHDPWPYLGFLLFILQQAYKELEERVGLMRSPRGEKTALVEATIQNIPQPFRVSDLQKQCPGVSVDLIRKILQNLRGTRVECLGRGTSASWRRIE